MQKGLGFAWQLLFRIPVLMMWGEHWALTAPETKDLVSASESLLKTVPKATRAQILAMMEKYVPISVFIGVIASTIYPRYLATTQLKGNQPNAGTSGSGNRSEPTQRETSLSFEDLRAASLRDVDC